MTIDYELEEIFLSLPPHAKIMVVVLVIGSAILIGYIIGNGIIVDWINAIRYELIPLIRYRLISRRFEDMQAFTAPYDVVIRRRGVHVRVGPSTKCISLGVIGGSQLIQEESVDDDGKVWGRLDRDGYTIGWICLDPRWVHRINNTLEG